MPKLLRNAGLALLFVSFLLPGHYSPWATFESQAAAALGVGLVGLGAALSCAQAGQRVPWPALAMLAVATAAIPAAQFASGQIVFFSDALLPALYLVGFGLAVITGTVWARNAPGTWLDLLFLALGAAAMVSVALALLQWLSIEAAGMWVVALKSGMRPYANLAQPNHLATLLALGAVGLWRSYERRQIGGPVAGLAMGWLGFGLVMAQSRTGWLFVLLLLVWWATMRRRTALRTPASAVLTGAALFAAAIVLWEPLNEALLLQAGGTLSQRLQAGPRGLMWQTMLEAVARSPWLGYGWNQVIAAQQAVAVDMPPVRRMIESAHNVVLDLALWAGMPLALIWVAAVGAWLVAQTRRCANADAWAVLAAIGALLLHAQFEYPLEYAFFLLPLGLLMGTLSVSVVQPGPSSSPCRTVAWPLLLLPVASMLVALGAIATEYLRVEQASRDVRMQLAGFGAASARHVAPPDVALLDGPREYHRLMITPAREGMSIAELNWMRKVTQRYAFPPAMLRYALAAGLNGREAEASRTLHTLCAIHLEPRCEEARATWRSAQQQWPRLIAVPAP